MELFQLRNSNEDTCKNQERDNAISKTEIDKCKDTLKLLNDYQDFILKLSSDEFKWAREDRRT
jgi:hypothetical protein